MTAQLGVNCGLPEDSDPAAIARTGATFVRTVYRDNVAYRPWLTNLKSRGVECWFVGDSSPESLGDDERHWAGRMTVARSNYGDLVKCFQWGNEPDWGGIASWAMSQNRVNRLLSVARDVFPAGQFTLIAPGLVSGQPGWLDGVRLDLCDAVSCHPYNKFVSTPEELRELEYMLSAYRDWWGLPLWLGEYDSRTDNLSLYFRDFPGVERAAVFCWDSNQTAGEGINDMGINDNPRAMAEFVEATGGPRSQPPAERHAIFQLGFERWHNLEPALLGDPLKNERNVATEWQIQPTSRGVLSWVGGRGHAFVQHDGRVFRWNEDWPASREVPGS